MGFLTAPGFILLVVAFVGLGAKSLESISLPAQLLCASTFQGMSFSVWKAALICGTPLRPDEHLKSLRMLGLIHLIVVSGAHLIFLENFFLKPLLKLFPRRTRSPINVCCLVVYSLFAGLQPPLVRALFQLLPLKTTSLRIFISALLTALFFRDVSLSLLLSWACSMLISWPEFKNASSITQSFVVLVGLYPLLLPLGAPPLVAAFLQPAFSVLFGGVIFPLTALSLLLPLQPLVDFAWSAFFVLLKSASDLSLSVSFRELPHFKGLVFVLVVQFFYWRSEVKTLRQKFFGIHNEI